MIKRRFSRSRDIVSQIDGYIEKNIPSRWTPDGYKIGPDGTWIQ